MQNTSSFLSLSYASRIQRKCTKTMLVTSTTVAIILKAKKLRPSSYLAINAAIKRYDTLTFQHSGLQSKYRGLERKPGSPGE